MLGVAIGLVGRLKNSVSPYAVLGYSPGLVLDFVEEHYRTNSLLTTFDSALTATRAGNATMVDSDGKIKWAPHNLLTRSDAEQNQTLIGLSVVNATGGAGVLSYDAAEKAYVLDNTGGTGAARLAFSSTVNTTLSSWVCKTEVKGVGAGKLRMGFGDYGLSTTLDSDWSWLSITASGKTFGSYNANDTVWIEASAGSVIKARNSHFYRSDLGGMVDNPDRGDSYVPTTSAARYLPRRGHHVYNGSEWVNEGLLVESEARTNLVTYSAASTANWLPSGATLTQLSGSYLGAFAGVRAASNGATWHRAKTASVSWTSGQTYNLTTLYVAGTSGRFKIVLRDSAAATESIVSAPIGSAVTVVSTAAGAVTNVATEVLDGGVYRTTLTFVPNSTTVIGEIGIGPDSATVGQDIIALGAQLEAGSTPSSYIPTAGATVTRAAETLVIPSANLPWPTPQYVTGTELVTNGTFDTDTAWTKNGSFTVISGGQLTVGGAAANGTAYQNVGLTAGKVYALSLDVVSGDTGAIVYLLNDTGSSLVTAVKLLFASGLKSSGTYTFPFVATGSHVSILVGGGAWSMVFDNISVKEINPLSVSIAMDGRATGNTLTTARWYSSSTAYITQSIGTTNFSFDQYGAAAPVTGGTFTSGINVPFNIASRHGSTFINGAVDGVALTADLTPVALPDLSAANLQLGSTFMGTIGSFRIWADDIGDAGLVTATNPSTEPSLLLTFDSAETSFVDLGWRN